MSLRRFRLLLPSSSYLVLYVGLYLLANLPMMIAAAHGGPVPERTAGGRKLVLIVGLILYGGYRALAFHPWFRPGYRTWLESTPWTWRKPLPVGPLHPVWEDAAIVSALAAPAWYFGDMGPLAAACLALGGYQMALALAFASTGAWGFQYAVWALVGLAVRAWDGPAWGYAGAVLLGLAVAMVGLGRSLKRWPWGVASPTFDPENLERSMNAMQLSQAPDLGWPYDRLGPRRDAPTGWRDALSSFASCLLLGWWMYAVLGLIHDGNGRGAAGMMVLIYATIFLTLYRVSRYATGYSPPLDMAGRFARFRPILPSYDQIFLAPIVAVLAAGAVPSLLIRVGLPSDAALSLAMTLLLLALNLGGPDRRRWQLTARHRVVPAIGSTAKQKGGFIQIG